jgi:hypothetical protein
VDAGEPITFSADWSSFPYMQPTLTWTISAGTIANGQGTSTLKVITKGLANDNEITAMLTMGGIPAGCVRQASCTSKIRPGFERKINRP